MKGYYVQEDNKKESTVPTGRLHVEVINLPEFRQLIEQAKKEADQLQKTINRLSNFNLDIDFSVSELTSSKS